MNSAEVSSNRFLSIRWLATGLLLLMVLVFLGAHFFKTSLNAPWLEWVEAFAEAAMVGALADWFAVTALFRHPLGIPIPHTAVVPANKDRIGNALGEFVQENFLSADVLGAKLRAVDIASRAAEWLQNAEKTGRMSERLIGIVPDILKTIDDEDLRRFLRSNLNSLRKEIRLASVLATSLSALTHGDKHQEIFNQGLELFEKLLIRHEIFLRDALRSEMPWYIPNFIHDKVYRDVIKRVRQTIHEINANSAHEARQKFSGMIQALIQDFSTSPILESRCQEVAAWILESPAMENYLELVWNDVKRITLSALDDDRAAISGALRSALVGLGKALNRDEQLKGKVNSFVVGVAQRFAHEYRSEIVALVRDTVNSWDSRTVVSKIEQHVGRDLQFIRINGTLVGGLVGLCIHALLRIFGA